MKNPAQKKLISREKDEQAAVVQWLRLKGIPHIAHMTGVNLYGNFALINMLRRVGCLQPGIPDLQIPVPSGNYHSLFIEMKKEKGGVLSVEQKEWLSMLEGYGHKAARANGADEAIKIIQDYLEG